MLPTMTCLGVRSSATELQCILINILITFNSSFRFLILLFVDHCLMHLQVNTVKTILLRLWN